MKKVFIFILTLMIGLCGVYLFFNLDKLLSSIQPEEPGIEQPEEPGASEELGIVLDKEYIVF